MRIDTEVSDLFFNNQKEHWDSLWRNVPPAPTEEQQHKAITADAVAFVMSYPRLCSGVSVDDLVEDFINRL